MTVAKPTTGSDPTADILAVQGSSDIFSIAFDHSPLALTITALDDGRIAAVNEAFLRAAGYTRDEVIGRTPDELGLWVDPSCRHDRFAQMAVGQRVPDIEAEFRVKSGAIRVGLIGSVVVEISGRKCVLSSILDITDRRLAEERYRAIVESQIEMVCRFRMEGEILFVNAAYARARGTIPGELIGRNFWDFVTETDRPAVKSGLQRLSLDSPEVVIENRFETTDGVLWTLWTNRAVAFDSHGRPVELQSSGIDITERKEREHEAAFLGAITDELAQLSDPQEVINRVAASLVQHLGILRCVFTELDAAREKLTVIGHASRDGKDAAIVRTPLRLLDFFTPDLMAQLAAGRQVAVTDSFEDPRTAANRASYAWLEARAFVTTPYVSDGLWKGSIAVHHDAPRPWSPDTLELLRDLTGRVWARIERARAEQKLRESEAQLRAASEIKDQFLATLSHELRTPLNAVLGWTHMLRTGVLPPERIPQALEALERNAMAQSQLVDDLLDMSRIMSGKLPIRREWIKLADVVASAEETVRPAVQSSGVTLKIELPARPVLRVLGDPDRLRQVFWNLLSNAVKFTPAGGTVQLVVRKDAGQVVVVVRDTGEGIDRRFLPFVFERFSQADSSTTRRHSGLGLGLAIARHLVEAHGGSITAHSDGPDAGATFTVRLPLARQPRAR
ncbi:MAG TPA: PAS domain S-box protein [Vicinamibacterales bacterium]